MENSMELPQKKLKIELSYDPAIPFLCIYLDKTNQKRYRHHSSTNHNSQDMEAAQIFTNRWMDKEDMVCMLLSEATQKEKDEYHMIPLICGI